MGIDDAKQRALTALDSALKLRNKRQELLIPEYKDGYALAWTMSVGECFKNALDIRKVSDDSSSSTQQVFTQGNEFSFSEGDVFYNDKELYGPLKDASNHTSHLCIQIQKARSVTPETRIVHVRKITDYNGDFGGNVERRKEIWSLLSSEFVLLNDSQLIIEEHTAKKPSIGIYEGLEKIGAIEIKTSIAARFPGEVIFRTWVINQSKWESKGCEQKVTQDEFVRILINGNQY